MAARRRSPPALPASPASSAEIISQWHNLLTSDRRITDAIEDVVFGDRAFTWIDLLVVASNNQKEAIIDQALTSINQIANSVHTMKRSLRRVKKRVMEYKKKGGNVDREERLLAELEDNNHHSCVSEFDSLNVFERRIDKKSDFAAKFEETRIKLISLVVEEQGQEMDSKKVGRKQSQKNRRQINE